MHYMAGVAYREHHGSEGHPAPPIEKGPREVWAGHLWAAGWTYADQRDGISTLQKQVDRAEEAARNAARAQGFAHDEAERFRVEAETIKRRAGEREQALRDQIATLRANLETSEGARRVVQGHLENARAALRKANGGSQ